MFFFEATWQESSENFELGGTFGKSINTMVFTTRQTWFTMIILFGNFKIRSLPLFERNNYIHFSRNSPELIWIEKTSDQFCPLKNGHEFGYYDGAYKVVGLL